MMLREYEIILILGAFRHQHGDACYSPPEVGRLQRKLKNQIKELQKARFAKGYGDQMIGKAHEQPPGSDGVGERDDF